MPYVLTVDQAQSTGRPDQVTAAVRALDEVTTLLPFVRTVGDEFQGLLDDPLSVLAAILTLMDPEQDTGWHIGLGIGPVETPLADRAPAARGAAFLAAREAVERAKDSEAGVCVVAAPGGQEEAHDAEVVLHLLVALRQRRTPPGWEAVGLAGRGWTQTRIAQQLGISRQAVSQRLAAAGWSLELAARPVVAHMFARVHAQAVS